MVMLAACKARDRTDELRKRVQVTAAFEVSTRNDRRKSHHRRLFPRTHAGNELVEALEHVLEQAATTHNTRYAGRNEQALPNELAHEGCVRIAGRNPQRIDCWITIRPRRQGHHENRLVAVNQEHRCTRTENAIVVDHDACAICIAEVPLDAEFSVALVAVDAAHAQGLRDDLHNEFG